MENTDALPEMTTAGLCAVCSAPGALSTCAMCGMRGHAACMSGPAHSHTFQGRERPRGDTRRY